MVSWEFLLMKFVSFVSTTPIGMGLLYASGNCPLTIDSYFTALFRQAYRLCGRQMFLCRQQTLSTWKAFLNLNWFIADACIYSKRHFSDRLLESFLLRIRHVLLPISAQFLSERNLRHNNVTSYWNIFLLIGDSGLIKCWVVLFQTTV